MEDIRPRKVAAIGTVSRDRMAAADEVVVRLHTPIAAEEPTVLVDSRAENARVVAVDATHSRRDLREVAGDHHNRTAVAVAFVEADSNDNNAMEVALWEDRVAAMAARLDRLLVRKDNHNCMDHDVDLLVQTIPSLLRLQ